MFVAHVTRLCVSRSKEVRLEISDLGISMVVFVSNYPRSLDILRMHRWGQFLWSTPIRQSFGTISPLFSGYTISLPGCVSGEQWGGAAKILSQMGVDHGSPSYEGRGHEATHRLL